MNELTINENGRNGSKARAHYTVKSNKSHENFHFSPFNFSFYSSSHLCLTLRLIAVFRFLNVFGVFAVSSSTGSELIVFSLNFLIGASGSTCAAGT